MCKGECGPEECISFAVRCNAAVTCLWICSKYLTHSSAFWFLVWRYGGGWKVGWKPYHILNGDFLVLRCALALCANLMMGSSLAQLSLSGLTVDNSDHNFRVDLGGD